MRNPKSVGGEVKLLGVLLPAARTGRAPLQDCTASERVQASTSCTEQAGQRVLTLKHSWLDLENVEWDYGWSSGGNPEPCLLGSLCHREPDALPAVVNATSAGVHVCCPLHVRCCVFLGESRVWRKSKMGFSEIEEMQGCGPDSKHQGT